MRDVTSGEARTERQVQGHGGLCGQASVWRADARAQHSSSVTHLAADTSVWHWVTVAQEMDIRLHVMLPCDYARGGLQAVEDVVSLTEDAVAARHRDG